MARSGSELDRRAFLIVVLAICFAAPASFLIGHGEVLARGSDVVSNAAYGTTMFGDVYRAGWSVPKPAQMILFGLTYWAAGSLLFINLLFVVAAVLLFYCASLILDESYRPPAPSLIFAALAMLTPFFLSAVLRGTSGLLSTAFLFVALASLRDPGRQSNRVLAVVSLSAAALMRPENWVNTGLIVACIFGLKYLPRSRPRFRRADLVFLIPLSMPAVWHGIDYAVFGDPFYGRWLAGRYAIEFVSRGYAPDASRYSELLQSAFWEAFHLSSWLSARALLCILLSAVGVGAILMRQPRLLLLMSCPFIGNIAVYFVAFESEVLFRSRFLFYNYVFILFAVSVGIAQLGALVPRPPAGVPRNALRVGWVCLAVLLLVRAPFQSEILDTLVPRLEKRAAIVKRDEHAIRFLKDQLAPGEEPVIITTLAMPSSRVALALGTGKDIHMVERLVGLEHVGVQDALPALGGRVAYLAYETSVKGRMKSLIERLERPAIEAETIYEREGLRIRRCLY